MPAEHRFSLELGPTQQHTCDCCGAVSTKVHGLVYKDGDAFAVYLASWSPQHADEGIEMAIATGDWSEEAGPEDRVAIGLRARRTATDLEFMIVEPEQSPWRETSVFGRLLSRQAAKQSPALPDIWEVAEFVVRDDPRIADELRARAKAP